MATLVEIQGWQYGTVRLEFLRTTVRTSHL